MQGLVLECWAQQQYVKGQTVSACPSIMRRSAYSLLAMVLALALFAALFGTGARPAEAAGLVVSVTQYGAVGDGSTDNTTAFRNALTYLGSAGGGTLTVPSGTFILQAGVLTVNSNSTVAGSQAILKANAIGYSLFDISGANITFSGLTIDGNNLVVQGTEIASGSSNILLSQDTYQNFTQTSGIGSQFYGSLPVGVRIDGNSNGITIDGVTVQNIVAINPNGTWPNPVARGIWIAAGGLPTSKNITIENSTFGKVAPKDDGDCIVIQDATDYANLQVLHNTFNGCAKRAIKIEVPGAVIANNTIINPFLGNNPYSSYVTTPDTFDMYSAISVYASNVAVFGNTITGVGSYYNAIELGSGAPLSNVSVQNNNVQMGSASGANLKTPSSFLRSFSAIDELTVSNNVFSTGNAANTVPNGIRLDFAVTRPTIKNNTMSNVTTPIQCASACQAPYAPSLAVPAYFAPGASWTQLDQAAPPTGLAVINPNNGPGASLDPGYATQVAASQTAGVAVLGYVYTKYANSQTDTVTNGGYDRTIANVEADIDRYFAWYHIDGIFLDEATNTCDAASLTYYTTLVTYIKEHGGKGLVALNPGTATGECYLTAAPAADFFVTFEGHYSDYISGAYSQPAWVSNYSPSRFWHLIYDAPDVASMQNAVTLGNQRGAGWLYVTPNGANGGNPWGALPSNPYWTDELDALQGIQPPAPVGLVNGNFAAGLTGWTPFCRTWGQVPLTPTSVCGNFATTSGLGVQLSSSGTQYNQAYIGVTQTVATTANAVLSGTATVNTMATCNTDGAVFVTAHLLNASGAELGSIVFYRHPYTITSLSPDGCNPYIYPNSSSTVYYQDMPTWLPGAGPQNFTMDVATLIAQHLSGVNAAQVAGITVELMNYADFTRPTLTFGNLSLSGNPVPAMGTVSPATAAAGSTGPITLTVNGANFMNGAVVQWDWNGQISNLPASVSSGTQLSAVIPASLLSTSGVASISVVSGGAASNQAPFYVTNSGATVSSSNSTSGSLSVTATTAGVAATAMDGSGTVTVAQYAANPAPSSTSFTGNGTYFDVHVATGSTFTSLTIQDCSTNGGSQAYWYSPSGGWTLASNQTYNALTGCIAITASNTGTSPTIAQLTGSYFTFKAPASQPQTITFAPATTSYTYSPTLTFPVAAAASSGLPVAFSTAAGDPCTVSATPNADGSSTITVTGVGTCHVTAAQSGNSNFTAAAPVTVDFTITQAAATITLGGLAQTYDGTAKVATATTAPTGLSGVTISYSQGGATVASPTNAGSYAVVASLNNANYQAPDATGVLVIAKAAPVITWANPADIVLGTALGASQLNASSSFQGSPLAGTLTYTPAAGAVLGVGPQTLALSFAPTDSTDFTTGIATATINVRYASAGVCDGAAGHTILQPINADGTTVFKQGQTVPAKFRVCDANGVSIGSAGVVTSFTLVQITSGTTVQTVTATVDSNTPDTAFRWDPTDQQWIFNVNTKGLAANSTYLYRIALNDGTSITMQFGLK